MAYDGRIKNSEIYIQVETVTVQVQQFRFTLAMDKVNKNQKLIKDLSFLQDLPKETIYEGITKYLEKSGTGNILMEITIPAQFHISFVKFDYEGRFINQVKNIVVRNLNERSDINIPPGVYEAVKTMKLYQVAWFNLKQEILHEVRGLKHNGCHFCITVEEIKYKNADTLESKQLVYDRNKKEGKQLFLKKDYAQAIKKYKTIVNITAGLEKKKYNAEEQEKLLSFNLNGKQNFLRCFIKLNEFQDGLSDLADQFSKDLVEKKNDNLSLFLRSKTLLKRKYVTDSLSFAEKLYERDPCEDFKNLVKEVKEKLASKKLIK